MKNLFVTEGQKFTKHVEGDIWEEKGKLWTIKNGIKRTVNKMDEARKELITPMACPTCGRAMKHHLDEKMWAIHKLCFNCTIDMEHEIMKAGRWKEYEQAKMSANAESYLKDLIQYLEEEVKDVVSKGHVTEDGIVEKWKDVNSDRLQEIKNEVIDGVTKNVETLKSR
jgi:hypothetical protein